MRILVVEDERQLAGHLTRALVRHGHFASAVHDGAEALRLLLADPPDLVVLDLNLPGLDGLALLGRLRAAHLPTQARPPAKGPAWPTSWLARARQNHRG